MSITSTAEADLEAEQAALACEGALRSWLESQGSVLVGFSGGVDSAYLATVAVETLGPERTLAVIGRSASYPAAQWATARAVAERFGVPVLEVDTDEMNDPRYAANPVNRCYFCKSELWDRLVPVARARGFAVVADGTNADDTRDHRPGAAAARERSVASPLAEVGLTKAQIRWLSQRRGIPTWSQPSSPCLSSRVPYGTAVTAERLAQVERAEAALRSAGVMGDLRVRFHDDLARIEVAAESLQEWLGPERTATMERAGRAAGFSRVAIDLRGFRSGSLNVLGGVTHEESPPRVSARDGAADWPAHARELQQRLALDGLHVRVEARAALAIVTAAPSAWPVDPATRRAIVRAALDAGFSHVAVEVDHRVGGATEGAPAQRLAPGEAIVPGVRPS